MIWLSDGMYHPHESTEMVALDYFKRAPFKILLRGHGGEMAKAALAYPVMVKPEVYKLNRGDQVLDYIFNVTNLVLRDIDPVGLFTPDCYLHMKGAARQSLIESCASVSEKLAPADVCLFYYINEHIRRQVVASLEIFRSQIEVRMPYVDEAFLKLLLQLEPQKRNTGEIHFELIKRCMPELIKVPNSNTGAALDANRFQLFILDKFHSVMKRLSIFGFRHYTEFQDWYRKSYKFTVEKMLFSQMITENRIFNDDYLRSIFIQHTSGNKNYAHLLGTAIGLKMSFDIYVNN
jgi:asparagine synthase (glutamine-hydrolysing)